MIFSLLIFISGIMSSVSASYLESEKSSKEIREVLQDREFDKFRAAIKKCLSDRSMPCLMKLTHSYNDENFGSIWPDMGDPEFQCSGGPEKLDYSPSEVYECIFQSGGKNLLKSILGGLEPEIGSIVMDEKKLPDRKKEKFFVLRDKEPFCSLRIQKIKGVWKIIGIGTGYGG